MDQPQIEQIEQKKAEPDVHAELAKEAFQPRRPDDAAQEREKPLYSMNHWFDIGKYRFAHSSHDIQKVAPEISFLTLGGIPFASFANRRFGLHPAKSLAPFAFAGAVTLLRHDVEGFQKSYENQDQWLRQLKYGTAIGADLAIGSGVLASVVGKTRFGGTLVIGATLGRLLIDLVPDHILQDHKPL